MSSTRYVTGHDSAGKADILFEGAVDRPLEHHPGFSLGMVWRTDPLPVIPARSDDVAESITRVMPACGGTTAMLVSFPPDSVSQGPDFDAEKAGAEFAARLPDMVTTFEADGSGYHATNTIDYGVVLEGEVWLDLGDGRERLLRAGDVVVQVGTRHAWRNRSAGITRMFFVMVGAVR